MEHYLTAHAARKDLQHIRDDLGPGKIEAVSSENPVHRLLKPRGGYGECDLSCRTVREQYDSEIQGNYLKSG